MESINTIGGALGLSVVAMSIVFLILGGLALMMVFIKHIAKVLERAPAPQVSRTKRAESVPASAPYKGARAPEPITKKEEVEKDIAAIAAALAAFLGRKTVRVWRIVGPVRTTWKEAGRIESIMGGYESNE